MNENNQNKGVGSSFLQHLQLYTHSKLHTKRVLIWFTHDKRNTILTFYRNLGFHPAITFNFALGHTLPYALLNEINDLSSSEYLLECTNDIKRVASDVVRINQQGYDKTCNICGYKSSLNFVCQEYMKGSSVKIKPSVKSKKTPTAICGLVLCMTCNSQFGVQACVKKCVFHSPDKVNYSTVKKSKITKSQASYFYPTNMKFFKGIFLNYRNSFECTKNHDKSFSTVNMRV